jgi:hypothetical protein
MSNITALDSVIRRIEKEEELLPNEVLVKFDTKKRRVTTEAKRFDFFSSIQKYAISHSKSAQCCCPPIRMGNSIMIEIKYEVSIPTGNQNKVVECLYHDTTLEAGLNNYVKQWGKDYVDAYPIDSISNFQRDLEGYIEKKALDTIGISLIADVIYKGNVNTIVVKSDGSFAIRVTDYINEQVFIQFETELGILDETTALLQSRRTGELQKAFSDIIRDYFSKYVRLHTYCFDLDKEVKERITARFNDVIKPLGRFVSFLSLKADSINILLPSPNPSEIIHPVEADIKGYKSKITVENKLRIKLQDIGKFKSAKNITTLESWFKDTIATVVKDTLFDLTYKDLLLKRL